jgi:hypothetical protein
MRQGWKLVVLGIVIFASMAGHEAFAAFCFPYAGGLPGQNGSGPPVWWSATATPTGSETDTFIEDPRWRGAFADIWGNQRFRVLVENTGGTESLVMAWDLSGDPGSAGDILYFGVWDDTSSTGNIYQLTRRKNTTTPVPQGSTWTNSSTTTAFDGRIYGGAVSGGTVTWTDLGTALPTWLTNDARVDVDCSSGICDIWAIRIRAKIDPSASTSAATPSGIKISTGTPRSFHFWYEIQDDLSANVAAVASFPNLAVANGSTLTFPPTSSWAQAQLGSSASCDGDILFTANDVYVNSPGSTTLDLTSNVFHARPRNNVPSSTPPGISSSELTARFRIANWGSAGHNSPEWVQTCQWSGSGALVGYPDAFDLSCTWGGFEACPYQPAGSCDGNAGTKDPHQCILVDLGMAQGATTHYTFSAQSVYKNMDFDVNSTLERHATIDTQGFGDMPDGSTDRDVYIYVHTRNMPENIADEPPPPPATDDKSPDRLPRLLPPRQRFKDLQLPEKGAIGTKESARIQAAVRSGRLTLHQVEQIMPTYIVYVWHDTGKVMKTPAGTKKLLEPQPSFGLFLAHDGSLDGWKHELAAAGAVQIGPNFYKVSAKNKSTFRTKITIAPVCSGPMCWPWWIWAVLVTALVLIVILVFRKKK